MKVVMETARGLWYKLRIMGVPITTPSYMYGDNMSVIHNTQRPESTLKKKSSSICYDMVRERVAMNDTIAAHIPYVDNCTDITIKVLPGGQKRNYLI